MNQSINTDSKNSKEPQKKYRLGTVSIKIYEVLFIPAYEKLEYNFGNSVSLAMDPHLGFIKCF